MAKILLVEDYESLKKIYQAALAVAGHSVDTADDGSTALKLAEKNKYDLIVLDILMPTMSGLDFLRQFTPKFRKPPVKVIAISNVPNPDMVQEAVDLGVDKFLAKPNVTPKELSAEVEEVLGIKKKD